MDTVWRRHPMHVPQMFLEERPDLRSAHIVEAYVHRWLLCSRCSEPRAAGGALAPGAQAVHGRRTRQTPRRNNGVTDGASQGGRWDERHNGSPIQVVHDVPARMEEPAKADAAV